MNNYIETGAKDRKYFSSIRNYTLALLNTFNNLKYWVEQEDSNKEREFIIPISFGNYEKSCALQDLDESIITSGNFNFLPRLVLSFEGMTKMSERQTNKFQKITKKIYKENSRTALDVAYNSLAYDFHFTLLLQARGLTIASQITEEILINFNPSLNLMIQEFPLFDNKTETQILIADPAFEKIDEYAETDVNIIQVTFDITIRGNIYSPIDISGAIETVNWYNHMWNEADIQSSKLASYYKFDISESTGKVYKETSRHFDATEKYSETVVDVEQTVIDIRKDYNKYQSIRNIPDNEYITKD